MRLRVLLEVGLAPSKVLSRGKKITRKETSTHLVIKLSFLKETSSFFKLQKFKWPLNSNRLQKQDKNHRLYVLLIPSLSLNLKPKSSIRWNSFTPTPSHQYWDHYTYDTNPNTGINFCQRNTSKFTYTFWHQVRFPPKWAACKRNFWEISLIIVHGLGWHYDDPHQYTSVPNVFILQTTRLSKIVASSGFGHTLGRNLETLPRQGFYAKQIDEDYPD